jgi:transcriptional regulator with XRE-family HTH domain
MLHNEQFAEQFKKYRLQRLWTLRQMANAVGVTIPTIWKIENGRVKPHDLTVAKILRALPDLETKTA